jgi:hypothetical protein
MYHCHFGYKQIWPKKKTLHDHGHIDTPILYHVMSWHALMMLQYINVIDTFLNVTKVTPRTVKKLLIFN